MYKPLPLTLAPPPDMGMPLALVLGPLLVTSGGHHWRPVQTCSFEDTPPPVLTSDGQQSTYGWKLGGTHPTGILSCYHLNLPTRLIHFQITGGRFELSSILINKHGYLH